MKPELRLALSVALGVFAWSCAPGASTNGASGGDAGAGASASDAGTGSLPCDIDAVLATNCRSCHGSPPLFGAPMPLVTLADLHAPTPSNASVPVYTTVGTRTHDDAKPMPPAPNARLGAADQATLDAWIASGAPAGNGAACTGGSSTTSGGEDASASGSDDGAAPTDCVFDTHIAPTTAFTMTGNEIYACYGFDIAQTGKRHVTQIRVHLDNKSIVHHALLLESPTSVSGTPMACDPAPSLGAPMMYAWAPGGNPMVLPPQAGFPQDQTTHYLVQVHYNNALGLPSPQDSSGFDLCTTSHLRPNDADVIAFGTDLISLPPLATTTIHSCFTVPSSLNGATFFAAFPHMHKLGTTMSTELLTDGGAPVDMGTIANWQFSNQPWLTIDAPLGTSDVVRTSCTWDNTGPTTVSFGQSTTDEMCYSFSAYYPKASPSFGWGVPATTSVPCP